MSWKESKTKDTISLVKQFDSQIHIAHLNVRRLFSTDLSKHDHTMGDRNLQRTDIVCLTMTHLHNGLCPTADKIVINNTFNMHRCNTCRKGGAVIIYINNKLNLIG